MANQNSLLAGVSDDTVLSERKTMNKTQPYLSMPGTYK